MIGAAVALGCLVVAVVAVALLLHAGRGPSPSEATQIHTATGPTALVPNVVGDTESEAQQVLSSSGYLVHVDRITRGSVPGTVVTESPSAGSRLPLGTKVVLAVTAATHLAQAGSGRAGLRPARHRDQAWNASIERLPATKISPPLAEGAAKWATAGTGTVWKTPPLAGLISSSVPLLVSSAHSAP